MIHQIVVEVMSITEKKGKYSYMEAFVDTILPLQACSLITEGKNNLLFNGIISKQTGNNLRLSLQSQSLVSGTV